MKAWREHLEPRRAEEKKMNIPSYILKHAYYRKPNQFLKFQKENLFVLEH